MDRSSQTSPAERCDEHNLAVGPSGVCVLCRRERVGPAARSTWISPVVVAASLGTALLAGVALGHRRPPPPPVVEATAAEKVQPVEAPAEGKPVDLGDEEPPPRALPTASAAASAHAPPQRNYLDEAYAAMPKGNLYDEAPASATAQPSASGSARPPPRPRSGMGRGRSGGSRH
jgi:hypothetical protein